MLRPSFRNHVQSLPDDGDSVRVTPHVRLNRWRQGEPAIVRRDILGKPAPVLRRGDEGPGLKLELMEWGFPADL